MGELEWVSVLLTGGAGAAVWQVVRVILDAWRGAKADEREQEEVTRKIKSDANTGFAALAEGLQGSLNREWTRNDEQRVRLDLIQVSLDAALEHNRALKRRANGWEAYAHALRQDIYDGRPPPPRDPPPDIII